jgi:hypothetical protein
VFAPSTYVRLGVSNTYFIPRPTASAPSAIAAFSVVAQLGVRGVAFALAPSLARRVLVRVFADATSPTTAPRAFERGRALSSSMDSARGAGGVSATARG